MSTSLRAMILGFGVILCAVFAYRYFFPKYARQSTPIVANRALWNGYKLPPEASDVTFKADFGGCAAEFAIAEKPFQDWCKRNGWELMAIKKPVPYFEPIILPSEDRLVEIGFTFKIPGGRGVYDTTNGRAGFWVSTFP